MFIFDIFLLFVIIVLNSDYLKENKILVYKNCLMKLIYYFLKFLESISILMIPKLNFIDFYQSLFIKN